VLDWSNGSRLRAVLVTHPPRLLHARPSGSVNRESPPTSELGALLPAGTTLSWVVLSRLERPPAQFSEHLVYAASKSSGSVCVAACLRPSRRGSNSSIINPTKGGFMESVPLDVAGHRRSPATMPGYHKGRPPCNKGEHYPADPPTVEQIVAVMRTIRDRADGHRLRALIVLLWRAGLRISEALALQESDLDRPRGAVLTRRGKGGRRREVGMDRWAWEQARSVA
jgi:hypothetical protein